MEVKSIADAPRGEEHSAILLTFIKLPFVIEGTLLSKVLTCMIFSCINTNGFFIKETDTYGHIVV